MILRVLDHYNDFQCIADKCQDSCCVGWEIDIDEDTHDYYMAVPGKLGQRLKENMYQTKEGDYTFRLAQGGRCPFLNEKNLCDICAALGEEAFSEVCTEYPRFSSCYGNVLQKSLAMSCEEVGRLIFTNNNPMEIVDMEIPSEMDYFSEDDFEDQDFQEDPALVEKLQKAQAKIIDLLQDREKSLEERVAEAFEYAGLLQQEKVMPGQNAAPFGIDFDSAQRRFQVFDQMDSLNEEWENEKERLGNFYANGKAEYERAVENYLASPDYCQTHYEHLLVYFVFRYFMTAVLDGAPLSKLYLALNFTLFLRDMSALRFAENGGVFTTADMIDLARIFSKEVEHSEENVDYAEGEFYPR